MPAGASPSDDRSLWTSSSQAAGVADEAGVWRGVGMEEAYRAACARTGNETARSCPIGGRSDSLRAAVNTFAGNHGLLTHGGCGYQPAARRRSLYHPQSRYDDLAAPVGPSVAMKGTCWGRRGSCAGTRICERGRTHTERNAQTRKRCQEGSSNHPRSCNARWNSLGPFPPFASSTCTGSDQLFSRVPASSPPREVRERLTIFRPFWGPRPIGYRQSKAAWGCVREALPRETRLVRS